MGIVTLQEGVTKVRIEFGRNRLDRVGFMLAETPFTDWRDANERYIRHDCAENMMIYWKCVQRQK
ncbi:MAG: hypothetical protein ACI8RD_002144 [Bacillariaceae sp.]|jgi:hypothetical protein